MKRIKSSQVTVKSQTSVIQAKEEIVLPPLDELKVCIKNLRVTDQDRKPYTIAVSFFDQLLLSETILPIGAKDPDDEDPIYSYIGTMFFDPADYTKMCLFADCPLVVRIQPADQSEATPCASCCNVDVLALFQGVTEINTSKRMEPMVEPTALQIKSWDNLPLITMKLQIVRNPENSVHHAIIDAANFMKVTVVAAYNVIVPYDTSYEYVAATKIRLSNQETLGVEMYKQGIPFPNRFSTTGLYPRWESISWGDVFRKCEEKLSFSVDDIQNNENINLNHYLEQLNQIHTVVWGSFHRSLLLADDERLLERHLRQHQWPLEIQMYNEEGGFSFMGFLDLFKLLYPGETTVRLAVPLQWADAAVMMERCGCDLLLSSNDRTPRSTAVSLLHNLTKDTLGTSGSGLTDTTQQPPPTGADESAAFVILEVTLARPLIKPTIPPFISELEIESMLGQKIDVKRTCTGRGQQNTEWRDTVASASLSLRRLPHFGTTDFCTFYRQLSESRTRVELTASFWQDAAVYVNNNFVPQDFLHSKETYEEMLMMAHACLVRDACAAMVGAEVEHNATLRAARHARQLQDIPHATDLFLLLVAENENNANAWRELSTCLKDKDVDLARVCINEALLLDPRHPLTLLSKGSMLYQEDPDSAELFFSAILALYPFWTTGWVIAHAFYNERQEFHVADEIKKCINRKQAGCFAVWRSGGPRRWRHHPLYFRTRAKGLAHDLAPERGWQAELGDWWYPTPLLPVSNLFLEAADLLLRLREMPLAEVCLALALSRHGAEPAHSHLVALTCRLRGDVDDALCHINGAFECFGEIHYLRSLEAECFKRLNNQNAAMASFEKAGNCVNAHSILSSLPGREPQRARGVLVDLLRRQPSAKAWMALANDWLMRQAAAGQPGGAGDAEAEVAMSACAAACAEQALRWDRRCSRAWALLARLTQPAARREFCRVMAAGNAPDSEWPDEVQEPSSSQQSLCHRLGSALKECRCNLCETADKPDCAHLESAITRWFMRVQRVIESYMQDVPPPGDIVLVTTHY